MNKIKSISLMFPLYKDRNTVKLMITKSSNVLRKLKTKYEIIIVDDCSTDGTWDLITKLSSKDERIKAHRNPRNMGIVYTLNHAIINLAQYEYIARMDADDECEVERLERQEFTLSNWPEIGVVGTNYTLMGRDKKNDIPVFLPLAHEGIIDEDFNFICHPSVMFRRSLFIEVGGYRPFFKSSEDYDLWLRMSKLTVLCNLPYHLLRYRLNPAGISSSRQKEMVLFHKIAYESFKKPEVPLEIIHEALLEEDQIGEILDRTKNYFYYNCLNLYRLGQYRDLRKQLKLMYKSLPLIHFIRTLLRLIKNKVLRVEKI